MYETNVFSNSAKEIIAESIKKLNENNKNFNAPITICIGSDIVLGDSLGPLCGTLLKKENENFIYGTLNCPITAKEVNYVNDYINKIHPNRIKIVIDAAIGNIEDIGCVKITKKSIKPGLGVNKNLSEIGDISIIGIVSEKSKSNYKLYNKTRLNLIYKMAEQISGGISLFYKNINLS